MEMATFVHVIYGIENLSNNASNFVFTTWSGRIHPEILSCADLSDQRDCIVQLNVIVNVTNL